MITENVRLIANENVYEPREDSYLLAEAVEQKAFGKVLDLGTGSGLQGIVAAKKGCETTFVDIDENALAFARQNAELNKVSGNFIKSDLFSGIKEKFNTIIFNPPYLPSSPLNEKIDRIYALDGGIKGREIIDKFISQYSKFVLPEHTILMIESSLNFYKDDIEKLNAKEVGKTHMFFEDIVVLEFK